MDPQSHAAVYGKYADEYKTHLALARQAYIEVALTADTSEEESARICADVIDSWHDPAEILTALESAVRGEGADRVAASARAATRAIEHYSATIIRAAKARPEMREREIRSAKDAYGPTYKAYANFLYDASESLGDETFLRTRS